MVRMMKTDDLSSVLSLYPRTVRGAAIGSSKLISELVDLGVLVPAGVVAHRLCDRCELQHFAEIVSSTEGQGWHCPVDGFIVPELADIAAYSVRIDAFASALAGLMDRRRFWAKPNGAPILWSVGSLTIGNLQIATYFAPGFGSPRSFGEIVAILSNEPRSDCIAILTNDTQDFGGLALPCPGKVVPLADCLTIGEDGHITLNREWLARLVVPEHLVRASKKAGRPNKAEQLAAALIGEQDRDGALEKLGQNERHRALQAAARSKHGPRTTLSKVACNKAWIAHRAARKRT